VRVDEARLDGWRVLEPGQGWRLDRRAEPVAVRFATSPDGPPCWPSSGAPSCGAWTRWDGRSTSGSAALKRFA